MYTKVQIHERNIIMADEKTIINVDLSMFGQDADAKTAAANKVAKELGISDEALAQVEDFKRALTAHNAWDLPFMGYVNEDGYGYAYVPDAAITMNPYWDAHIVLSTVTAPTCSCTIIAALKSISSDQAPTSTEIRHSLRQRNVTAEESHHGTTEIVFTRCFTLDLPCISLVLHRLMM